jgi:PAP2 superfamily
MDNLVYNRGPIMNLMNSPSYPSGNTTYGFTGNLLLAILVPEQYQQMIAGGAEYGNDRIVIGAHYAMDVIGGRTLAIYDLAHLLANDPAYVGRPLEGAPLIKEVQAAVKAARRGLAVVMRQNYGRVRRRGYRPLQQPRGQRSLLCLCADL